ncbi:MAG TPA: pectinesterase family protein [Polyangia bacterium]|nr:pectinesterase family protein [Polyangia bacterium]
MSLKSLVLLAAFAVPLACAEPAGDQPDATGGGGSPTGGHTAGTGGSPSGDAGASGEAGTTGGSAGGSTGGSTIGGSSGAGTSGAAGDTGAAGESGAAGTTGTAGRGGTTGAAGAGGRGGSTGAGGSAGTSGAAGAGGRGGSTGAAGAGGRGGAAGTGGAAGASGRGGTTGTAGTGGAGGGTTALCPSGITQTITVAKDGSGQFTTVQSAVNSIASGSSAHIRIDIKAGTYTEKLTIASRTNLCLVGAGATTTILSYGDSSATVGSTSGSASVLISANDFSAANLTIQNSYGTGSQAVALRTTGQRQQFLNCRFVGYQDTLYTHSGTQYFRNCYVQGNTDYVFGGATAVLENCEVRNVEGGSATSAPNTDIGAAYGIVYLGGKFTAASGVKANSVGLGRPWGADGAAAFVRADLGAHIIAAGFVPMSDNQPQNARFHEYQSTGAGANASARSSYQLSASQAAAYTVATVLAGWTPSYSQ